MTVPFPHSAYMKFQPARRSSILAGASALALALSGCNGTYTARQAKEQTPVQLDTPLSNLLLVFVRDPVSQRSKNRSEDGVLYAIWSIQEALVKGVPDRFPEFARLNGVSAEATAITRPTPIPRPANRAVVTIVIKDTASTRRGAVRVNFDIFVDQEGAPGTESKRVWTGQITAMPGNQGTFAGRPDGPYGPSYVDDFCASLLTVLSDGGVIRLKGAQVQFPPGSNHRDRY